MGYFILNHLLTSGFTIDSGDYLLQHSLINKTIPFTILILIITNFGFGYCLTLEFNVSMNVWLFNYKRTVACTHTVAYSAWVIPDDYKFSELSI